MSKFYERRVETGANRWWAGARRRRERRVKANNWHFHDLMFVNSSKIPVPPPERRKLAAKIERRVFMPTLVRFQYNDNPRLQPSRRSADGGYFYLVRGPQEKTMKEGRPFDLEAAKAGAKFYSTSDPRGLKLRHYTLLAVSKRGVIFGELDEGCMITGDRAGFRMVPVAHVKYTQVRAQDGKLSGTNTLHDTFESCEATINNEEYTVARIEWES